MELIPNANKTPEIRYPGVCFDEFSALREERAMHPVVFIREAVLAVICLIEAWLHTRQKHRKRTVVALLAAAALAHAALGYDGLFDSPEVMAARVQAKIQQVKYDHLREVLAIRDAEIAALRNQRTGSPAHRPPATNIPNYPARACHK
jgi:hypothetical protein